MLKAYAVAHELRRPSLCALLVLRATRSANFATLKTRFAGSEPKAGSMRVTARVSQPVHLAFEEAAALHGLGADDAAAMVFRAELTDKWLAGIL
jgi:hypothetical protein